MKSNLRSLEGSPLRTEEICAGSRVLALWGSQKEEFEATILTFGGSMGDSTGVEMYRGALIKVRPEKYTSAAADWDRWYLPAHIKLIGTRNGTTKTTNVEQIESDSQLGNK